jgi:hypothetical protein
MRPARLVRPAFVIAAALSSVQAATAEDACFSKEQSNNYSDFLGDRTSWGIARKQAHRNWEDWIWRGAEFHCSSAAGDCGYSTAQGRSAGYDWSVGVDMKLDNLPVIGSALNMFNIGGQYQHSDSYTETFGWSQQIKPGQHARPLQIVVRRWKSGDFQGGWWRVHGGGCWIDNGVRGAGAVAGNRYWWDGNARYGSWSANVEERRFAMYHVW